jgi:hypothetical protein
MSNVQILKDSTNWMTIVEKNVFQYGVSADVYSLSIIIFELFTRTDPFPGNIFQIIESKREDRKPAIPSDFPFTLKQPVVQGWSKDPMERPPIQEFKSALNKMQRLGPKNNSTDTTEELITSDEEAGSCNLKH